MSAPTNISPGAESNDCNTTYLSPDMWLVNKEVLTIVHDNTPNTESAIRVYRITLCGRDIALPLGSEVPCF